MKTLKEVHEGHAGSCQIDTGGRQDRTGSPTPLITSSANYYPSNVHMWMNSVTLITIMLITGGGVDILVVVMVVGPGR